MQFRTPSLPGCMVSEEAWPGPLLGSSGQVHCPPMEGPTEPWLPALSSSASGSGDGCGAEDSLGLQLHLPALQPSITRAASTKACSHAGLQYHLGLEHDPKSPGVNKKIIHYARNQEYSKKKSITHQSPYNHAEVRILRPEPQRADLSISSQQL